MYADRIALRWALLLHSNPLIYLLLLNKNGAFRALLIRFDGELPTALHTVASLPRLLWDLSVMRGTRIALLVVSQ